MVLVVDDMLTIDNPFYLWRFVNDQTRKEWLLYLTNELQANSRADRFILLLPDDIPDFETGDYHYYVYESADEVLNIDGKNLLATGRADVLTEFAEDTTYERTGEDKVYKGFNS